MPVSYNTPSGSVDNSMIVSAGPFMADTMRGRVTYRVEVRGRMETHTSGEHTFAVSDLAGVNALRTWARGVITYELGL